MESWVREGHWSGHPDQALDESGAGKYFFEVGDAASGKLLYSRGFCSIYGEWELTAEAKEQTKSFSESFRFPMPNGPVEIVLKKRDEKNDWREVWTVKVDPAAARQWQAPPEVTTWAVMENGEPEDKVDLLLIGDGYTAGEMEKWHADAKRLAETLFAQEPFKSRRQDFNVWAIDVPSAVSGIPRPSDGVTHEPALGTTYDAMGSERYVLNFDNKRLRDVAAAAPYEFMEIVVNNRKYGGGGIYNLYATVAADNAFTPYIFVHEFGHHFAGLADEYYTSDVAYESSNARVEPWEPNATADPQNPKWKDMLTPGVPLPTPWPKQEFEEFQKVNQAARRDIRKRGAPEEEMEELFREEQRKTTAMFGPAEHAGKIGAFEGAMYESQGYYRAQIDCMMFSRDEVGFCEVCQRAIGRMIDAYSSPQ